MRRVTSFGYELYLYLYNQLYSFILSGELREMIASLDHTCILSIFPRSPYSDLQ